MEAVGGEEGGRRGKHAASESDEELRNDSLQPNILKYGTRSAAATATTVHHNIQQHTVLNGINNWPRFKLTLQE